MTFTSKGLASVGKFFTAAVVLALCAALAFAPAAEVRAEKIVYVEPDVETEEETDPGDDPGAETEKIHYKSVAEAEAHPVSGGVWEFSAKHRRRYRLADGTYLRRTFARIQAYVYSFDGDGFCRTGDFVLRKKHYHATAYGRLAISKFVEGEDGTYYYNDNGCMIVRSQFVAKDGNIYWASRTGIIARNVWVSESYYDENGVLVTDRVVDGRYINRAGIAENIGPGTKVVIAGASRINDMSFAVRDKDVAFLSKPMQGYKWLSTYGVVRLRTYLRTYPDVKVVFQFGNNDPGQLARYIRFYRKLQAEFPDTEFYYMDCMPGDKFDEKREHFNETLRRKFPGSYIGGYDWLVRTGYTTVDRQHYPPEVNLRIYRYIRRMID